MSEKRTQASEQLPDLPDLSITECVLLDFDGTLVDSEPLYYRANAAAFRRYGHEIDESEYYRRWSFLGEGPAGEIRAYELEGIDPAEVRRIGGNLYRSLCRTENIPLLPGAREALTQLPRRGYQVAIASNTPPELIREILAPWKLPPPEVAVTGGGPGLRNKPHPDIFLHAMKMLHAPPGKTLVVEDTLKGLRAAQAAGIPCVLIRSHRYPRTLYPEDAAVLPDLFALLNVLQGIPPAGASSLD